MSTTVRPLPQDFGAITIEAQIHWLEAKRREDHDRFQSLMQQNRMKPHTAEREARMTSAVLASLHELRQRTAIRLPAQASA